MKKDITIDMGKNWQHIFAIIIIIGMCVTVFSIVSQFQQLPGPIYGGDVYFHLGITNNIATGNSPFQDSMFLGEYEHYPWLTHLLVAGFSAFTGGTLSASIYFTVLEILVGGIIVYLISSLLFENKFMRLLLLLAWFGTGVPLATPSSLTGQVVAPLLLLGTLYLVKKGTLKYSMLFGIIYGVCALSHILAFLAANLLLILYFLYEVFFKKLGSIEIRGGKLVIHKKEINARKSAREVISRILPVLIIGVPIALLYWVFPIFTYSLTTLNPWQQYTGMGTSAGVVLGFFGSILQRQFFNTSGIVAFIVSILALIGFFNLFRNWSRKTWAMVSLLFFAALIGILHPIVTEPLAGISFGYYRFTIFLGITKMIFVIFGITYLYSKLKTASYRHLFLILIFIILLANVSTGLSDFTENQWVKMGFEMQPTTSAIFQAGDWIKENTNNDDVFLSPHGETGFAMNALTGRKVVIIRRTHASPFIDMNKRFADAAVMLYGDDTGKALELMEEYNVKYFYTDFYSAQSENTCEQNWEFMAQPEYGDLSMNCMVTSPEYEDYLNQYGVETLRTTARLDPSSADAPRFEIVVVRPKLNAELQQYMSAEKTVNIGEQPAIAIFKINYPS